ncbi:MAG TPA: hypothetical protein VK939_01935 [Longimicrobiales bacterium]|nr:hypothetical protein [Longimicrobiales bacterium]
MTTLEVSAVPALLALGAAHGVNPAMGWLFAVALGLQEKRARAVWRALAPLAVGHALAIAAVLTLALLLGRVIPMPVLRWGTAAVLLGFGLWKLLRGHRHPRYGGMRVTPLEIGIWSFLMASAHGAGLMVLPFVLNDGGGHHGHAAHAAVVPGFGITASALHALGYLVVTGLIAVLVYERLGLRLLRSAWINLDVLWAGALILTALVTPLL